MRLTFVSDTHCQERWLTSHIIEAKTDILVHAGDFTWTGRRSEIGDFADWAAMLLRKGYTKHVVLIAGNHELLLDPKCVRDDPGATEACVGRLRSAGIAYLQDSGVTIEGIRFYGIPWTPRFGEWGFQIDSPGQDEDIFGRVPHGIDVLISHGPPSGIRDYIVDRNEHTGSQALRRALARVKPRICVFGHIHHQYGMTVVGDVFCINASTCNGESKAKHRPITVDIEPRAATSD